MFCTNKLLQLIKTNINKCKQITFFLFKFHSKQNFFFLTIHKRSQTFGLHCMCVFSIFTVTSGFVFA